MVRLLPLLIVAGCASEAVPTERAGRQGVVDAAPAPVDAAIPDAAPPDAAPPDAGAPQPADRPVWVIQHHEDPAEGLRAALDPPQRPEPVSLAGVDGVFVRWMGPSSPGEAALRAHRAAGRRAAPLYPLAERVATADDPTATVAADVRWLAAHHLVPEGLLSADGRPWLGVTGVLDAPLAWSVLRLRLREVVVPPAVAAEIDPNERPRAPDGIDALFPAVAHGYSTRGAARGTPTDAARLIRWRQAARAVGLMWLPTARAPRNPRLDDALGAIEPPGEAGFVRSLVLARRAAEPQAGPVLVDGLGRWRDDRQLDPVAGTPSRAPSRLTDGLTYRARRRLDLVRAHLRAPARAVPSDLGRQPPVVLLRAEGVTATLRGADPLRVDWVDAAGHRGRRLEVLLDARPFVVPPDAHLTYTRDADVLAVDLVFADGTRLLDLLAPPNGPQVTVSLAPFAGRRVEDVSLVVFGDAQARGTARLGDLDVGP